MIHEFTPDGPRATGTSAIQVSGSCGETLRLYSRTARTAQPSPARPGGWLLLALLVDSQFKWGGVISFPFSRCGLAGWRAAALVWLAGRRSAKRNPPNPPDTPGLFSQRAGRPIEQSAEAAYRLSLFFTHRAARRLPLDSRRIGL